MRFTRHEILVNASVKIKPAILHTVCCCCDDTIWLEMMYQVSDDTNNLHNVCKTCADSKYKAYELVNPKRTTVQDILIRNAERVAELAVKKVELAQSSLRKIIQTIQEPDGDWNPNRDRVIVGAVVEAENTLKELSHEPKNVQLHGRRRTKKREVIPENKEQVNV